MKERTAKANKAAPFAYAGLDRVIHEKARLGILASLAAHTEPLAFNDLKQLCALTDGNLNRHLLVLQEAGLIEVRKESGDSRPQTVCQLTPRGRQRFADYVGVLEQVVRDADRQRGVLSVSARTRRGWSTT